jgi:hypothetical protein
MLVEVLTQGNEALALANKDSKTFDRSSKLVLTVRAFTRTVEILTISTSVNLQNVGQIP